VTNARAINGSWSASIRVMSAPTAMLAACPRPEASPVVSADAASSTNSNVPIPIALLGFAACCHGVLVEFDRHVVEGVLDGFEGERLVDGPVTCGVPGLIGRVPRREQEHVSAGFLRDLKIVCAHEHGAAL